MDQMYVRKYIYKHTQFAYYSIVPFTHLLNGIHWL